MQGKKTECGEQQRRKAGWAAFRAAGEAGSPVLTGEVISRRAGVCTPQRVNKRRSLPGGGDRQGDRQGGRDSSQRAKGGQARGCRLSDLLTGGSGGLVRAAGDGTEGRGRCWARKGERRAVGTRLQMSGHEGGASGPRTRLQTGTSAPSVEHAPILWVHGEGRGELCPRPGVQGVWKFMWAGLSALGRCAGLLG